MTALSVNVNKLATLRNSRGKNTPNVTAFARKILEYGAHGITVHPRPDGRHIRTHDVEELHRLLVEWNGGAKTRAEYNIEGYPSDDFLMMLERFPPDQATLVPDPPEAITSNAGWDLVANEDFLAGVIHRLKARGIRVSLFIDPARFTPEQQAALSRLRPERVELYTEAFAEHFGGAANASTLASYVQAAEAARALGIGVNAGHDLSQANLAGLLRAIPWIDEVSIGHALVCEALEQGFATTIANYLRIIKTL